MHSVVSTMPAMEAAFLQPRSEFHLARSDNCRQPACPLLTRWRRCKPSLKCMPCTCCATYRPPLTACVLSIRHQRSAQAEPTIGGTDRAPHRRRWGSRPLFQGRSQREGKGWCRRWNDCPSSTAALVAVMHLRMGRSFCVLRSGFVQRPPSPRHTTAKSIGQAFLRLLLLSVRWIACSSCCLRNLLDRGL